MKNPFRPLYDNAYFVLTAASFMWAGNTIIGKVAVGHVTPMGLTLLRWVMVCAILFTFYRKPAMESLPVLLPRWRWVVVMAAVGYTAFNALLYLAAHHTSGVNMTMLQASIPVFVLIGGALAFAVPVSPLQALGTALTLAGVAIVASGGDLGRLMALQFNIGDVFILVACAFYAGYTLALRKRPPVSGFGLFIWFAVVAMLASLPLVGWEMARGEFFWPTPLGWLMLVYIALCPSLLSQIFYIRGVDLIGPARAGLFINLVPIFGAFMAVAILGEPFHWAELIAAVLTFGGIALAEMGKGRGAGPVSKSPAAPAPPPRTPPLKGEERL